MKSISILFFVLCSVSLFAQDVSGSKDHEIISRYPGSEIRFYYQQDYAELKLPTAVKESVPAEVLTAKGKHTSILYAGPKDVSPIQIFRNYEEAIKQANGNVLFSCEGKYAPNGCDDYKKYYSLSFFNENYYKNRYNNTDQYILMNGSDDQAFLLAVFEEAEKTTYVEIGIDGDSWNGQAGIQVEIIEEKKMVGGLITAKAMKEGIDKNGKIALYDIHFDTGKATLKPTSNKQLDAVVEYLKNNADVSIYVVGHTDDTGQLSLNVDLSEKRAKAVKDYLVSKGISASRIVAKGVASFAPVSTNETEGGRKLNRRVELVKQLK
ncbi:MAG: DUF4892 domain-containing protein [Flavobacteriales bacterium]|nr:DUF4892 domain-containing protein [Flavobacteriales bacterium]